MWILYLLECKGGHFYTGITTDLNARYQAHLNGIGAKYTRSFPPIRVLAFMEYPNRATASQAEAKVKRLKKANKLAFFESPTA